MNGRVQINRLGVLYPLLANILITLYEYICSDIEEFPRIYWRHAHMVQCNAFSLYSLQNVTALLSSVYQIQNAAYVHMYSKRIRTA